MFLKKFKGQKKLSAYKQFLNNCVNKIKNLPFFSKEYDQQDDQQDDYYLSIDNPNKQPIYIINYYFPDNIKSDVFNNILSIYNSRLYENKKAYYSLSELVAKGEGPADEYPDPLEEIEKEDGFYMFDLKELDPEKIKPIIKLNKLLFEDVERNIANLSFANSDELISFTIVDSFDYLSYFYNFFKMHDLTSEEICLLFQSIK